jgi:predicted unusual protein kinase regulating ubiquinone biosynthesis (AarF/ABC1/UbiB family)
VKARKPGAAGRALRMATMTAGVAGSYVGYLVQHAFLDSSTRRQKLEAAHAQAGRRMRREMQDLRGPIMKLGQTLSLHTAALPEALVGELSRLQMRAPGMHPSLVRAQIRASLGRDPDDLFAEFEPEPVAAASLGQVHRARLRDGRLVAVKVQYPGIRTAIEHDFRWFRNVSRPAQASGHMSKAAIDELEAQIVAETDYRREADNLEFFGRGLAPLPWVTVPAVERALSADRVLTMSFVTGAHLDDLLASRPGQARRDEIGRRLFELFYFQQLRLQAFHADPHWGNYLFMPDEGIGLVDFGCVKYLRPEFVETLRAVYLYAGRRESAEFQRVLERRYAIFGYTLTAATRRALSGFSERFYRKVYPPEPNAPPFDFGDASFLREYLREAQALARARGALPEHIFMARAELGLYQTLHRLRARVPTSAIVRQCLQTGTDGSI